jgi:hypothetical protein
MTDNLTSLRTRIATAIASKVCCDECHTEPDEFDFDTADAVIEALNLGSACIRGGCRLKSIPAESTTKASACFAGAELPNTICDCLDCCG